MITPNFTKLVKKLVFLDSECNTEFISITPIPHHIFLAQQENITDIDLPTHRVMVLCNRTEFLFISVSFIFDRGHGIVLTILTLKKQQLDCNIIIVQ